MGAVDVEEITRLHEALERLAVEPRPDERTLVAAAATAAQLRQWDDALALARAALVTDPGSARAWAMAGAALEGKGELAEARKAYETSVSLDDKDLATALAAAHLQAKTGARSAAQALATFVLLRENGAPELRARAQALLDSLAAP